MELDDETIFSPPYCGSTAGGDRSELNFSFRREIQESLEAAALERVGCWLYSHVAIRTTVDPRTNVIVMWKSNKATDARNEMTMLRLVAKPLRILSEYLITMAVTRPPSTWTHTVAHAHAPKFSNRREIRFSPAAETTERCAKMMGANAGRREKSESWTLRTHRSAWEFLSTISKYTPAKPEVKHAANTAMKPFMGFMACVTASFAAPAVPAPAWIWTMPTPTARNRRDIHWLGESFFRRSSTEKAAVVRIFIWYVTWKVAASRFDAATYCRLF